MTSALVISHPAYYTLTRTRLAFCLEKIRDLLWGRVFLFLFLFVSFSVFLFFFFSMFRYKMSTLYPCTLPGTYLPRGQYLPK